MPKLTASQLFSRTGRARSAHSPRTMWSPTNVCRLADSPLKPSELYDSTASGVSNRPPGSSVHSKPTGLMPDCTRICSRWVSSTAV